MSACGRRYDLELVVWARSMTDVRELGDWIRDNVPAELAARVGIVAGPTIGVAIEVDQAEVFQSHDRRLVIVS